MDNQPGDDLFDRAMVFLSNNIVAICEEWFRLLSWLLIISAFSFCAQQVDKWYLYILPYGSIVILWLRCLIGYHAKLHSWIDARHEGPPHGPMGSLKTALIWAPLTLLISLMSGVILKLAILFATELSNVVKG